MIEINRPDSFRGEITAPPSKSYSHRAFALSLTATGPSYIIDPLYKGDVATTIEFLKRFGAEIQKMSLEEAMDEIHKILEGDDGRATKGSISLEILDSINRDSIVFKIIPPQKLSFKGGPIDVHNSGTSVRIMAALASLIRGSVEMTGVFFKRNRPIAPLLKALEQIGVHHKYIYDVGNESSEGNGSEKDIIGVRIISSGPPYAGTIKIPGDVSSQFITALMFLAPNLRADPGDLNRNTIIELITPAKSYPYLLISEHILHQFGVQFRSEFNENLMGRYIFPPEQRYGGIIYRVPGDFSSAAFIAVLAALHRESKGVVIKNLDLEDPQGDKEIFPLLERIGADIKTNRKLKSIEINPALELKAFEYDCSQTPDLFPILSVLAIFCKGTSRIFNAEHVRIKETDRISVMVRELRKMGASIEEHRDGITVHGPQKLHGATLIHDNDHRIAMALIIAAINAEGPSTMDNEEIVGDSYPEFFTHLKALGIAMKKSEK